MVVVLFAFVADDARFLEPSDEAIVIRVMCAVFSASSVEAAAAAAFRRSTDHSPIPKYIRELCDILCLRSTVIVVCL